jgi:DNA-binding beta-propeller fold protein YncE
LVGGKVIGPGPDALSGCRVGELQRLGVPDEAVERRVAEAAGVAPQLAAVDSATGIIYVTDFGSAGVTVLDGSRCNATVTSGCGAHLRELAVGSEPAGLAVSPQTSTVYVADTFQAGSASVLATDPGGARQLIARF